MALNLLNTFAPSAADPHSLTITGATEDYDVFLLVHAPAVVATPSGWTLVSSRVDSTGAYLFQLPGTSNPGGTIGVSLDLTASRAVAVVAFETDLASGTLYNGLSGPRAKVGLSIGGGAHTFTERDHVLAIFMTGTSAGNPDLGTVSYDNSFTTFADTGWAGPGTGGNEASRVSIGARANAAFTSDGPTMTVSGTLTGVDAEYGGVLAWDASGLPGGGGGGGGSTPQTVTLTPPSSMTVGDSPAAVTAVSTSLLDVTVTSSTPSVCTISGTPGDYTVNAVSAGTCTLVGTQDGDATYAPDTDTQSFSIAAAPGGGGGETPPPAANGTLWVYHEGEWIAIGGAPPRPEHEFHVDDYGAAGDSKDAYTGSISSGNSTLTIVDNEKGGTFETDIVGKAIYVKGAGASGADLLTTVATRISATQVTLAAAASTTVSNATVVWGTDDTQAIRDTIDAATAWALAGPMAAKVVFGAKTYLVSSPTIKNSTTKGNAQIPLPYVDPDSGRKLTLELVGAVDAGAWMHWAQPRPQVSGSVVRSVLSGLSSDGTYGAPSVIGGPSTMAGFTNGYSNLHVRVDKLTVMAPFNPGIIALDLYGCAMASIGSFTALASGAVPDGSTTPKLAIPTNDLGIGLRLPSLGNNDNVTIDSYGVEGFYTGLACADHTTAQRVAIIFSNTGVFIYGSGALDHGLSILNLSIEVATLAIQAAGSSGGSLPVHIPRLDMEGVTNLITDTNDYLRGELHYQANNGSQLPASGARNLRIVNDARPRGAATAPSVPSSTTALLNPFQRDAAVTVTGGTVSAIAVDGQTTGLTSGTVIVPSQKTITLTYSGSPSWAWTLL